MTTLSVALLILCAGCASRQAPGPRTQPAVQRAATGGPSSQQNEEDDWGTLWPKIKAAAPETDPPTRIGVALVIETTDATADALLNSFVKREVRSLRNVSIAPRDGGASCFIQIKALVVRPEDGQALYFLSYFVAQRYDATDEGVLDLVKRPKPSLGQVGATEEASMSAINMFALFGQYLSACHSRIWVPVDHDIALVSEAELKQTIELKVAQWDSRVFQPTVQNVRAARFMADILLNVANEFDKILQEQGGQEQPHKEHEARREKPAGIGP